MTAWRSRIGLLLLAALALWQSWQVFKFYSPEYAWQAVAGSGIPTERVIEMQRRLQCVADRVSPDEVVGFYSTVPPEKQQITYLQMQYALAPVIMDDSVGYPRLVAWFDGENKSLPPGFSMEYDCQNGAAVLRGP